MTPETTPPLATIDPLRFRQAMGLFATGVATVCALQPDGTPIGIAANSFASVSLEPPLVSFCVARTSSTWAQMQDSNTFAVSFLAADQGPVCSQLSRKGIDRFADLDWEPAPSGSPHVAGALGWVDCRTWARYDGGDHEIVVGEVTALSLGSADVAPLLFFRSAFLTPEGGT